MVEPILSLRTFIDGNLDPSAIPNLREIVRDIIRHRLEYTNRELRRIADQFDAEASSLEKGVDYELRFWNIDHWHYYDVIPATTDTTRHARWMSDALRDPSLANRLLGRLPPNELAAIRDEVVSPRDAPSSSGLNRQAFASLIEELSQAAAEGLVPEARQRRFDEILGAALGEVRPPADQ